MLKVGKKASFLVTYGSDCVVLFKQSYLIEINIYIYIRQSPQEPVYEEDDEGSGGDNLCAGPGEAASSTDADI